MELVSTCGKEAKVRPHRGWRYRFRSWKSRPEDSLEKQMQKELRSGCLEKPRGPSSDYGRVPNATEKQEVFTSGFRFGM